MHPTRESWLAEAVAQARPIFASNGATLPDRIRVSCGLPSTFSRSGTLAECWADADSADQTYEVMVSPTLADPAQVLAQLMGALAHAAPGAMSHTSGAYIEAAANLGLCPMGDNWRQVQACPPASASPAASLAPSPAAAPWPSAGPTPSRQIRPSRC